MMSEWQQHEVSELIRDGKLFISDGYRAKNEELSVSGLPFARVGNIKDGFHFDDADYFPEENLSRVGNKLSQPGDVVFTSKGTVGRFAFVHADTPRFVYSPQLCFWRVLDRSVIEPRFLFYWMFGEEFYSQFKGVAGQTDMAEYVSLADQRRMRVTLPPLPEQRAIAHILGALDDKIELNRRTSATLEAMARALFKAWFVDFEPVRAKCMGDLDGRPRWRRGESLPGLPAHLYDLFPDRLVDSPLGPIPEGWEVGRIGDVAQQHRRTAQPVQINPTIPYISLEHMPRGCITLSTWDTADGLESNKYEFKKGEILFGKLRPYFHKVGIAPLDGVCSTDMVVIAPKNSGWFGFVLGHVSSVEFVEYVDTGSTGTKMPRTSWADMARYEVAMPPVFLADIFTNLVQPFFDQIVAAIHQSRTLAALRDALLPKLISGKLRVKDAERFLKERGL